MHPFKASLAVLALSLSSSLALAAEPAASALTPAQKEAVEAVVRELLLKKEPELIIKAAQEVETRMEKESQEKSQAAINKNIPKLLNDPDSPIGGNPKGDVSVIQFFDYTCGYCKVAQTQLEKFLEQDKNVRLVYKEFPVLGAASVEAAKASLASIAQGKYIAFHNALMASKTRPIGDDLYKVAKEVGLDIEKLKKDMQSDKIEKILAANKEIAEQLGARGTPTFIIGKTMYPGAMPIEQLKQAVDDERKRLTASKK